MNRPLVIAHRGASQEAPENTLAAFRLAWRQGADAVETDLRLTADASIVAFHDADGRRMLRDPRRIRDIPLAMLQSLDIRGQRVPTLDEVLATAPPSGQLVLELKENLAEELAAALRSAPHERIVLIAFDAETIAEAKRRLPRCRALWLFSDYASAPARRRGKFLAERVRELGVDGVDLRHAPSLNAELLAPLRDAGRLVFTYTVNHAISARRCLRLGLDGITTDRPGDMRRWLGISA